MSSVTAWTGRVTAHIVWYWAADCSGLVVLQRQRSCLKNCFVSDWQRVFDAVCLSFCEQDFCKPPISLKLSVMIVPTSRKNRLIFGSDPVPDTDSGSLFHFPHHCGGDMRFISISNTVTALGQTTDANTAMNPQHFGSDPAADPQIRIRTNLEIRIWIPDHCWLRLDALAEVCALWTQSIVGDVVVKTLNFSRLVTDSESAAAMRVWYYGDARSLDPGFQSHGFLFYVLQKFIRCHRAKSRWMRQSSAAIRPVAISLQ